MNHQQFNTWHHCLSGICIVVPVALRPAEQRRHGNGGRDSKDREHFGRCGRGGDSPVLPVPHVGVLAREAVSGATRAGLVFDRSHQAGLPCLPARFRAAGAR